MLLPKDPVQVGESWNIDLRESVKELPKKVGPEFDADRTTATGKLLRVYKKDGRQFGVIEVRATLPIAAVNDGKQRIPARDSKMTFQGLYDACIDGNSTDFTVTGSFQVTVNAEVEANSMRLQVVAQAQGEMQESRRDVPQK
jgi:hypothetical protein